MKLIVVAVGIVLGFAYFRYGTLSPCGMLRMQVRLNNNLSAMVPDALIDLALGAKLGALTPEKCIPALFDDTAKALAIKP
ncbi:MAG: hypothetical protein FJX54_18305 [Alphaproteobacteria bacterium]|nr:hypothetical protein [Alphaproteobacteria bacterium]